jgi:hypothetical protein
VLEEIAFEQPWSRPTVVEATAVETTAVESGT